MSEVRRNYTEVVGQVQRVEGSTVFLDPDSIKGGWDKQHKILLFFDKSDLQPGQAGDVKAGDKVKFHADHYRYRVLSGPDHKVTILN